MRHAVFVCGFTVSLTCTNALSEPVRLVCEFSIGSASESVPVTFDIEERSLRWGGRDMALIRADSKVLVASGVFQETDFPFIVMVHRETGRIVTALSGNFCPLGDCSAAQLDVMVNDGSCTKPF